MLQFHAIRTHIKFLELHRIIKTNHNVYRIPCANYETHEHLAIPNDNNENHRILLQNQKIIKILKFHLIIYENHEYHRIPLANCENHDRKS